MNHLISAKKLDLVLTKKNCCLEDFAVPVDHRIEIKENEKIDKYFGFARDLKKILTTVLLKSARILRRVLKS